MFGRRDKDDDDRDEKRPGMLGSIGRSVGQMALFSVISSLVWGLIRRIFNR